MLRSAVQVSGESSSIYRAAHTPFPNTADNDMLWDNVLAVVSLSPQLSSDERLRASSDVEGPLPTADWPSTLCDQRPSVVEMVKPTSVIEKWALLTVDQPRAASTS